MEYNGKHQEGIRTVPKARNKWMEFGKATKRKEDSSTIEIIKAGRRLESEYLEQHVIEIQVATIENTTISKLGIGVVATKNGS